MTLLNVPYDLYVDLGIDKRTVSICYCILEKIMISIQGVSLLSDKSYWLILQYQI